MLFWFRILDFWSNYLLIHSLFRSLFVFSLFFFFSTFPQFGVLLDVYAMHHIYFQSYRIFNLIHTQCSFSAWNQQQQHHQHQQKQLWSTARMHWKCVLFVVCNNRNHSDKQTNKQNEIENGVNYTNNT